MKKSILKIVVLTLGVTIFFAAVLCCDFSKCAMAGTNLATKAHTACKSCPSQKTSAPTRDDNSCCVIKLKAVNSAQITLNTPQFITSFIPLDHLVQQLVFAVESRLTYFDDPPGQFFGTPLYIQLHNFRI